MTSMIGEASSGPELGKGPLMDRRGALALTDDLQLIPDSQEPQGPQLPGDLPRERSALRRYLAAGDVVALVATWGVEVVTRSKGQLPQHLVCSAVAVVVTLATMQRAGLYRSRVCALRSLEAVRVVAAATVGTAAFVFCNLFAGSSNFAGPIELAGPIEAGAIAAVAVLLLRWRFTQWLRGRRSASKFLRTVVMVGANEDAEALWALLSSEPELGYKIGGIVARRQSSAPWANLPHSDNLDRIGDLADRASANGVIVVASALDATDRSTAVNQALARGLHVQIWPGFYGLSARRIRMAPVSGVPLLYVEPKRAAKWQLAVKRGMDLVFGSLLLLLSAPLFLVAALAIKLSDGSPIIHRSQRIGRDGAEIDVLKLRTMVPEAATMMHNVADLNERTGGPLFKASYDPRVTRVGRVLRATSIDEIPQLWNVLNGTMSLVGPRPALVHEVKHFDAELRRRHEMRPGITGLWQVEARDNPSFSAYKRLDLAYVDDWTLGLDVAIIATTVHELSVRALKAVTQLLPWTKSAANTSSVQLAEAEVAGNEVA